MDNDMASAEVAIRDLLEARKLIKRVYDAKGRAYRRTPGTATAEREHENAANYQDRADALFDRVEVALRTIAKARGGEHP